MGRHEPPAASTLSESASRASNGCRVFMVASGSFRGSKADVGVLVENQAASLHSTTWPLTLGVLDDRTSISGILRNVRRLRKEVDGAMATVVHAQYGSMTAAVAHWIRGSRPLVISFCGSDLLGVPISGVYWWLRTRVGRWLGFYAAARANAIIVKSQNLKEAIPRKLWNRCTVLPNGVDTRFFAPMDLREARTRLGWGDGKIILFNASQREGRTTKNLPLAQTSVDELNRRGLQVRLMKMENASRQEVLWMLNAADCLLVTSLHEGSPNIVKEAMACNLPVVSVPCGDVGERLNGVRPGRVASYDAQELAASMADVLAAGSRSNGREQLERQGLSAEVVADRLASLYQALADARLEAE
jgi:glycosyltransferase involved in cell wall biosynthesis